MQLVCPGLGDDQDLRPGPLAVLSAIRISKQIEFPHGIHAKQLLAGATWLHIVLGGACKLHSIQQEQILLRPVPRDRKVISHGGIRDADPARLFEREVDDARIEGEKLVVTAPIEGKILYLSDAHQSGYICRRDADGWSVGVHGHLLACLADPECKVYRSVLSHH